MAGKPEKVCFREAELTCIYRAKARTMCRSCETDSFSDNKVSKTSGYLGAFDTFLLKNNQGAVPL